MVLLYHRIAGGDPDPWGLAVSPENFAAHLDVLRRRGRPVPLGELVEAVREGREQRRMVAITFDDGYADNLHTAKPLLERFEVPATVFLASGWIGGEEEFWWDALARIFLEPGVLPERLELEVDGRGHTWALDGAARYERATADRHRNWRAWQPPPTPRHATYLALWRLLYGQSATTRERLLQELAAWADTPRAARASFRALDAAAVPRLTAGGLVEVGAHTVTHLALSECSPERQRVEIEDSKAACERLAGRPVTQFAYPHGAHTDETVRLVRSAGLAGACTTESGCIRPGADPYRLPRLTVRDLDRGAFVRRLARGF